MNILLETHAAHGGSFTEEFMELLNSPAHWAFELLFSILFDLVIITLLYGILIKKVIIPKLRKSIHDEIDKEHGITAHD